MTSSDMTPRARAKALLEEARDILAGRLAEQVLDAAEGILDDARGDSYMGEIDEVYERIGLKLVHVSQMLAHFPEEPAASPAPPVMPEPAAAPTGLILLARAEDPVPAASHGAEASRPIILPQLLPPRLALPRPGAAARPHGDVLALLALLAAQAQAGDLAGAAGTTAALLDLDAARAAECAGVYHRRQALDPDFIAGSMLLVPALEAARPDDALPLLTYCLGLEPAEAAAAYHRLRAKSAERA